MRNFLLSLIFILCSFGLSGQRYESFELVYNVYKGELMELDGVSTEFLWVEHILRLEFFLDGDSVSVPLSSVIMEVDGEWGVSFDGRYIIYKEALEDGFDCYIWYDKKLMRNIQVLFLNPKTVMGILIRN